MADYITPQQLSHQLDVPLTTIYFWAHQHKIPFIRLGRHIRFSKTAIEKWLRENEASNAD